MRSILAVMKKELKSIFTNKTILAQIIIIPFIYIFGFTMLMTFMEPAENTNPDELNGYYINIDGDLAQVLNSLGLKSSTENELETLKEKIKSQECDVIIMFPDGFMTENTEKLPDIQIWYDSSSEDSYKAFVTVSGVLDSLNPRLFTINATTDNQYDMADEGEVIREMLALIFPTYVFVAVILASQALAAESIAGDKERGFLNMMLLAPVKRYTIAIGKSISLIIVNSISTISAFAAVAVSLPKFSESLGLTTAISYSATDYMNFFILTISATTLLVSLILLVSTLASSVKQASSMSGVVMIIVMLISMLMSSGNDLAKQVTELGIINAYLPVCNSIIGMQSVFKQSLPQNMILITSSVNIIVTFIVLSVIAKLFSSEKIVNNSSN